MAPPDSIDSPSLKGPTVVVLPLIKVTVVATEPVEVQVRVEDEDPWVNIRGVGDAGDSCSRGKKQCHILILAKKKGRPYYS